LWCFLKYLCYFPKVLQYFPKALPYFQIIAFSAKALRHVPKYLRSFSKYLRYFANVTLLRSSLRAELQKWWDSKKANNAVIFCLITDAVWFPNHTCIMVVLCYVGILHFFKRHKKLFDAVAARKTVLSEKKSPSKRNKVT
jgi:hypothetical protein